VTDEGSWLDSRVSEFEAGIQLDEKRCLGISTTLDDLIVGDDVGDAVIRVLRYIRRIFPDAIDAAADDRIRAR